MLNHVDTTEKDGMKMGMEVATSLSSFNIKGSREVF